MMLRRVKILMRSVLFYPLLWISGCTSEFAVEQEVASSDRVVEFQRQPGKLHISIEGNPFATYVYFDEKIPRPYFMEVKTPSGLQVTRNHPPVPGQDEVDHATFHPGIWMAFGDISGMDYWRLKAKVEHEMFVGFPRGELGQGSFAVRNFYMTEEGKDRLAAELVHYTIQVIPQGYLLLWDSTFTPVEEEIVFGDQEEMGLGFRTQTPISVDYGGRMLDSQGRSNEEEIWGTQSDWVDYSGQMENKWIGITVMQHPENFRTGWYHARNYGFICTNVFGRKAMQAGEESQVTVKKGQELRLRYGILIHSSNAEGDVNLVEAYQHFVKALSGKTPTG